MTYAKKTLPRTLFKQRSSIREGRSVSTPSSPRNLWCSMWYLCRQRGLRHPRREYCGMEHTLNAAEYGMPIGKFANTASALFARTLRKARLCVISWIARNRLWLAVPPIMYAQRRKMGESGLVFRSRQANPTCKETTPMTTHFVRGSWPMSFVTCSISIET